MGQRLMQAATDNLSTRKTCPVACVTFAIPWEP